MISRLGIWPSAAFWILSITVATAQSLPSSVGPDQSGGSADVKYPKLLAFDPTMQLPGQPLTKAAAIKGTWSHQEVWRNVMFEKQRIPRLSVSLLIGLQPDGSYTLDYQAQDVSDSLDPRVFRIEVNEAGRFSLSGNILLLRAGTIELMREQNGTRTRASLASENRAYIARLDRSRTMLELAGPCARYQMKCPPSREFLVRLRREE